MDITLKEKFLHLWRKYFPGANLPVTFYYTDEEPGEPVTKGNHCVIGDIFNVMEKGERTFTNETLGCFGGKRYLGFSTALMPNIEYFLSCGIPGKMEGERYKKSPELAKAFIEKMPVFNAPAKYVVFKRWDMIGEKDNPEVAIFFVHPDIMSGLFTLVNFDEADGSGVLSPFGAGCMTTVSYPYIQNKSESPKAVMGLFDVSARPSVPENIFTIAIPMKKLEKIVHNMEESFLITKSWDKVKKRIESHSI